MRVKMVEMNDPSTRDDEDMQTSCESAQKAPCASAKVKRESANRTMGLRSLRKMPATYPLIRMQMKVRIAGMVMRRVKIQLLCRLSGVLLK